MSIRIYPPMPKVTDSDDESVEAFWGELIHINDMLEGLPSCGVCAKPCLDPEYSPYLLCSARCDNLASIAEDEIQQDREN